MRLLIQRVNHASVKVDGEVIGNIGKGFLVLVGIGQNDTREIADKYMKKMLGLRIFEDENGKTNLSLADVNGELLMVSPTAKKETGQALLKPVRQNRQMNFMNTC